MEDKAVRQYFMRATMIRERFGDEKCDCDTPCQCVVYTADHLAYITNLEHERNTWKQSSSLATDELMKWKQEAESAQARVAELEREKAAAVGLRDGHALVIAKLEAANAELVGALKTASTHSYHAKFCLSREPVNPSRGFHKNPCDCGRDHAKTLIAAALASAKQAKGE
jgi:hypothetical protein